MLRWTFLFVLGCANGPLMSPGDDCGSCHRRFTVSGTVYPHPDSLADFGLDGALVLITDADGKSTAALSNGAGNFYSEEPLRFPLSVAVQQGEEVRKMGPLVESGSCNTCHTIPASGSAAGRIHF